MSLAESRLTSSDMHGSFSWVNPNEKPSAAKTANYLAAETAVTIHVAKAEAPKFILPAASRLTYGQKLSESSFTGGENAPGSFA